MIENKKDVLVDLVSGMRTTGESPAVEEPNAFVSCWCYATEYVMMCDRSYSPVSIPARGWVAKKRKPPTAHHKKTHSKIVDSSFDYKATPRSFLFKDKTMIAMRASLRRFAQQRRGGVVFSLCRTESSSAKNNTSSAARQLQTEEQLRRNQVIGSRTGKPKNLLPLGVVTSPTVQSALPLLGHAAYVVVASGFLMTDMLDLRVVLVAGYSGLVAFHALHPRPLRIPLAWSALFILVNTGAAGFLLLDRYAPPQMSERDEALYRDHFQGALSRGQFYQLMGMASRRENVAKGVLLTEEGKPCQQVYFLERGSATIHHNHAKTATIEQGGFVNDVAFSQGPQVGAYGTVVTVSDDNSLLVWEQSELRDYLSNRPEMGRSMKYLMSDHLVKSLLRQREAAHERRNYFSW